MATAVMATGLQRPTMSSSARTSTTGHSLTSSRASAVTASRLAAGNASRRSTSKIGIPKASPGQKAPSSSSSSTSSPSSIKIPSLATALVQSGTAPKQVTTTHSTHAKSTSTNTAAAGSAVTSSSPAARRYPANKQPSPRPLSPPQQTTSVPNNSHRSRVTSSLAQSKMPSSSAATPQSSSTLRGASASSYRYQQRNKASTSKIVPPSQPSSSSAKETILGVDADAEPVVVVQAGIQATVAQQDAAMSTAKLDFRDFAIQTDEDERGKEERAALETAYNQMFSRFLAMTVVSQNLSSHLKSSLDNCRRIKKEAVSNEKKLLQQFMDDAAHLVTEQATSNAILKFEHEQQLQRNEDKLIKTISETKQQLVARHHQQVLDLETTWASRLESVKDEMNSQFEKERKEAADRLEEAQRQPLLTENEAVAQRVEAETVRFKTCFAENDSLRAVLDLRSGELRQLRQENALLKVSLEDLPSIRERTLQLEHQIENLEAVLEVKRDQERTLTERQRELEARLEDEEAEKRQVWQACEVLVYQLQSVGQMPLSASFVKQNLATPSSPAPPDQRTEDLPSPPPPTQNSTCSQTTPTRPCPPYSTPLVPHGCSSRFLITPEDSLNDSSTTCTSPPPSVIEARACSPRTESILQKIIETSKHGIKVAVTDPDGGCVASKSSLTTSGASSVNYSTSGSSDASPRSMSSNPSASPPPMLIDPLNASCSIASSTSGCFSSNELDEK